MVNIRGKLYLCATPIGNLDDISFRAIKTLKEADYVAAEDTRRTGILLKHFDIETPMLQYHKFNEKKQISKFIELLLDGKSIALVSDAGTPGISDPGEILVKECIATEIEVVPIPGACALICALTVSGLDTSQFKFIGFLPKGNQKKKALQSLIEEKNTTVFYQSPHDLISTLEYIGELDSNRIVVVVRELTKLYEETIRGTGYQLAEEFAKKGIKGEFTVVIQGKPHELPSFQKGVEAVEKLLGEGIYLKEACKIISSDTNLSQRELYQHMINKNK